MVKIPVGILGATGTVGQKFVLQLKNHPWFVASQFHPEFASRPNRPHPLFRGLLKASIRHAEGRVSVQALTPEAAG